jgi:hypothetical protein
MKPITINDLIKHLQEAADKFGGDKEVVFWRLEKPTQDLNLVFLDIDRELSYNNKYFNLQLSENRK